MKKFAIVLILFLLVIVVVQALIIVATSAGTGITGDSVVVIRIDDVIVDPKDYIDRIDRYKEDDNVKAVIFRLESPGGTVAAAQEVSNALLRLRDVHGKIVITSVSNIGASGGYYLATASDVIIANPGSLVGSIGVILEHFDISKLSEKIGVEFDAITAGEMKDAGSVVRRITKKERRYLQALVDDAHRQFKDAVYDRRSGQLADAAGISEEDTVAVRAQLDSIADGRIFTGNQAYELGLVDELGDLEHAIWRAEEMTGIEDLNVIYDKPEEPFPFFADLFSVSEALAPLNRGKYRAPTGLWYLYK